MSHVISDSMKIAKFIATSRIDLHVLESIIFHFSRYRGLGLLLD